MQIAVFHVKWNPRLGSIAEEHNEKRATNKKKRTKGNFIFRKKKKKKTAIFNEDQLQNFPEKSKLVVVLKS